jgi:NCS1 family nucleobase:cation symporter-1
MVATTSSYGPSASPDARGTDVTAASIGIEQVPPALRVLGFRHHAVLWADLGVGLLVLVAGSALVPALGFAEAVVAIVLGTVIGTSMLGLAGAIGSRHGVTSMVALRPSFGLRGSYLPSALNAFQLVGWGAFELVIMGRATEGLVGPAAGATYPIAVLVWASLAIAMGVGGPIVFIRQWLEKVGLPLVVATGAWLTWHLVTTTDIAALAAQPGEGGLTFARALDLVVAMPVSWLPIVADFNRFARDTRSAFWGTVTGFGISNVVCYILGALLILALPSDDLVGSILGIAFGAWGLLVLLADETDNAFADIYSGAMSLKNIVPTLPTRGVVVTIGAICAAIALVVDMHQYEGFLFVIGGVFSPLYGVLFADYALGRRERYDATSLVPAVQTSVPTEGTGIAAVVAWACGAGSYWWLSNYAPDYGGTFPSLLVTMVAYAALMRVTRPVAA